MRTYNLMILTALAILGACGKQDDKPVVQTKFTVKGKTIRVEGEMKPGAKISSSELKSAVKVTVANLEK